MVSFLFDRKVNVEYRVKIGFILLMEVVFGGYVEVGWVFLDKGVDVNVFLVFFLRDIVLIIVVDKGYYKFCEFFIGRGVYIDVCNKKGNILLWLVVNGGYFDVV